MTPSRRTRVRQDSASRRRSTRPGRACSACRCRSSSSARPTTSRTSTPAATTAPSGAACIERRDVAGRRRSRRSASAPALRLDHRHAARQRAGGRRGAPSRSSTTSRRAWTARTRSASRDLDVFIQPVSAPDDRDHNVRTTAWSFDPNRDRGTIQMPENAQLFDNAVQYPGLFFIDAHQQTSGYFFPPNEDAALHEISHFALDLINDVIGPSTPGALQRSDRRSTATTTRTTCSSPNTATPCPRC